MDGTPRIYQGLSELCDSYSVFVFDQWGVLHNGSKPYPHVLECLQELKHRGKKLVALSNSSKRAAQNAARLAEIGLDPKLFDVVLSSAEMTWQSLHTRKGGPFETLGKKCFLISRGHDHSLTEGTDTQLVASVAEADFILASGTDAPQKTLADYEPDLKAAAAKGLPLVCANPDLETAVGAEMVMGAGALAKRYTDFGGVVGFIGKPYPAIFRYVQHCLPGVLPASCLMVGDSLAQDIAGANAAMMDTCLVATGVHTASFRGAEGREGAERVLRQLSKAYGVQANFFIPSVSWGKPLLDRKNKKPRKRL